VRPHQDHTAACFDDRDDDDGRVAKRFSLNHAAVGLAFLK